MKNVRQTHQWKYQPEAGVQWFVEAIYHAKAWTFQYREKQKRSAMRDEDEWIPLTEIPLDLWQELRKIVWNKYQRRRGSWQAVESIDKVIADYSESADN